MKHHIIETMGAVLIGLILSAPLLLDFILRG